LFRGFFYFRSMKITGIILAGGKSSRMNTDKGLVLFKDQPLIQYSINVLKEVCDQILISSNTDAYDRFGYQVVPDEIKDIGPVGGIYSCLKASGTHDNIILSCDTPFISLEFLHYLLKNNQHALVAVPWFGNDKYEPISAYYHKKFASVLAENIERGNYKIPEIYKNVAVNKLRLTQEHGFYSDRLFYNINSLKDIEKLK